MTVNPQAWRERAACRDPQIDQTIFYPETMGAGCYNQARRICGSCDVRSECLATAMHFESQPMQRVGRYGMWGGLSPVERAKLADRSRRCVVCEASFVPEPYARRQECCGNAECNRVMRAERQRRHLTNWGVTVDA